MVASLDGKPSSRTLAVQRLLHDDEFRKQSAEAFHKVADEEEADCLQRVRKLNDFCKVSKSYSCILKALCVAVDVR